MLTVEPFGPIEEGCDKGLYQRVKILDDLSHINPFRRPPQEVWQCIKAGVSLEFNTAPDRPTIPQKSPGKPIDELKGTEKGPVVVMFNGPTLQDHDLSKISCKTIGMNRTIQGYPTYKGPQPDYYTFIDVCWLNKYYVVSHPKLINCSADIRPLGWRVNRSWRMKPFSLDLFRDGGVPVTTGFMALQTAVYLGFRQIYCLGLDLRLDSPHFDGTKSGQGMQGEPKAQEQSIPLLMGAGVSVWNVGSPDSISPFPKISFATMLERLAKQ